VPAGGAADTAGNLNTVSNTDTIVYNAVGPTVTMSSVAPNPTKTSPIPVSVAFSTGVTGFTSTDIVAGNATVSNFAGSGAAYTFNLIPTTQGAVTADIAAGAAQDGVGNPSNAAGQFLRTYDSVPP